MMSMTPKAVIATFLLATLGRPSIRTRPDPDVFTRTIVLEIGSKNVLGATGMRERSSGNFSSLDVLAI